MEIKTIKQVDVACVNLVTNLMKIGETVGVVPTMILEEIGKQSIEPIGAQIWNYFGCCGDPVKEFSLKISFPVNKKGLDTDKIQFETLEDFKCFSYTYKGSWSDFKDVYGKMFEELTKRGLEMNDFSREVYLHCDFENLSNCVTELQIGIN